MNLPGSLFPQLCGLLLYLSHDPCRCLPRLSLGLCLCFGNKRLGSILCFLFYPRNFRFGCFPDLCSSRLCLLLPLFLYLANDLPRLPAGPNNYSFRLCFCFLPDSGGNLPSRCLSLFMRRAKDCPHLLVGIFSHSCGFQLCVLLDLCGQSQSRGEFLRVLRCPFRENM